MIKNVAANKSFGSGSCKMTQIQEIQIHLEGISTALKTHRFKVPAYQRSYAWEKENVEALLNDIQDAIKNREKEYFLGSIVVTGPKDQRFEVVDGQQRLATVSLLVSAIKDKFSEQQDEETALQLKNDYLVNTDRRSKEKEPKLILNEIDNELYQELIEQPTKIDSKRYQRQSQERLMEASRTVRRFLDEMCLKAPDSEEELHTWIDYLDSNLKIIIVKAPDDTNAFIIFETLNDRGLELAISDLLKNYLFHKSGDRLDETKARWLAVVAMLESASEDPLIVTFLRHYSMSKWGLIREKDLFGLIKKKITSKRLAIQFSTELQNAARTYTALLSSEHEFWNAYNVKTRESISALNTLGMSQVRPLLLAIIDKFDPKNVALAVQKLVSVAVRFQIGGTVGSGPLERIYSETAKGVSDGTLKTPNEIINAFTTLPTDAIFKQNFASALVSKPALARYYLRCLEDGVPKGDGKELTPSKDTERVNLEHVLPLTPSAEWQRNWTAEDIKFHQRRLGNLALMSSKANSTAGNDSFAVKKEEYKKSKFELTKRIAEETLWTKAEIEKRQIQMAEIAVKIWPI
ncbi:MAG TPA: DUF262 domain-containing protein [Holophaga sp.]|nr:DUF262 domain-containing protein [Holophaga sp.]